MSAFKAIAKGLGTTFRKPRIVLVLYVFNLAFAVLAAVPFVLLIQRELGHSLLGSSVRPVDVMWIGEAVLKYGESLPVLLCVLAVAAVLYLALQTFLNGGVVGRLIDREGRTSLEPFFADAGRYFWRFVRIFLISVVFLILAFGVVLELVSALIKPASEGAATEWLPLILSNVHFLLGLLLLSIVRMVVDYTRIAVVADGEAKVFRALRHALKFLRKRFFRAWAIYLALVGLTLAGTVVFYAALGRFSDPVVPGIVAGLVLMQVYVLFRAWIRTLFIAAQAEYYKAHPY
jgi:hypothetical protein